MSALHFSFTFATAATLISMVNAPTAIAQRQPPLSPLMAPPVGVVAQSAAREQNADQQVLHALNRLSFGPRPGDQARVRTMGVDAWIDAQLHPDRIADAAGDALAAHYPALALSLPVLLERYPPPQLLRRDQQRDSRSVPADSVAMATELRRARLGIAKLGGELLSMRVARAVVSERQLQEVMVDFWENHFNIYANKGPYMRHWLVAYDRDAIRPHALGHFRDLLGAVAHSPAMLYYLDNVQSTADRSRRATPGDSVRRRGLNENYARELLELHTLGVDGGYNQQDVVEVARALTGWTVAPAQQGGGFRFRRAAHDADAKVVLGQLLPAGQGEADGEAVLDLLARNPATAHFISTKLVRRFVSDSAPAALVERASATFLRTDGDLREVVQTIVTSPEFFSAAAYRAKVKSPFETVVSALRAIGASADPTPRTAQIIAQLGQPIFGHLAPDGYPETGDSWINSGAILGRINFGLAVAGGSVPGVSLSDWPESASLASASSEAQVDGVIRALLGGDASSDTRALLVAGENPLAASLASATTHAAATAAQSRSAEAATARSRGNRRARARDRVPTPLSGLDLIIGLALGSPEFQRR